MSSIDPAVIVDEVHSFHRAPPIRPPSPPLWPRIRRMIVDRNPFFLFSAVFMLAGSLAVTNSLRWSPVRLERILLLTATINLYEILLVILAVALLRRPASRRDGCILLIMESFFIADVAFLNAELFAIDRWAGLAANVVLFLLVLGKLAYVARSVGIAARDLAMPLLTILAIFALPGVLKFYAINRGGTLPALAMLATWWSLFAIGVGIHASFVAHRDRAGLARWFVPLLSIVAGTSLFAHAGTSQWIYDLRFWGADLAPMLALAAFIFCSHRATRSVGLLFAFAAVFASISFGPSLRFGALGLTPIHLTVAVVYLVLAWTIARFLFRWLVAAGAVAALLVVFGPSLATIRMWLAWIVGYIDEFIEFIRPKTLAHWGMLSIATSFGMLALGAIISFRRPPSPTLVPSPGTPGEG